jgi:hypothetical protein
MTLDYWYYVLFVDKRSFYGRVRKIANIEFLSCFSVRLPARMEHLGSNCTNFYEIWHLSIFRKSMQKFQVVLKCDKSSGYLKTNIHFWSCLALVFLRMKNVAGKICRENKPHILYSVTSFRKSWLLWDNVEKYCTARQVTDDNMAHGQCMLDIKGYKPTIRICNTYFFSTATMVARTRLNVTWYAHWVSCLK